MHLVLASVLSIHPLDRRAQGRGQLAWGTRWKEVLNIHPKGCHGRNYLRMKERAEDCGGADGAAGPCGSGLDF